MTTRQLLDELIYPAFYEHITETLPEFGFRSTSNGYISTTGVKIDGTVGEKGKVYVYINNISTLIDYTRGNVSIWNYLQNRDNLTNRETLILLASLAKISIPLVNQTEQDLEAFEISQFNALILEQVNDFFINCLSSKESEIAASEKAASVRNYIEKERGYLFSDLRLPGSNKENDHPLMELGFVPASNQIFNYLISNYGYEDTLLYETLRLPAGAGTTHKLSIPFRDTSGRILGFIFRDPNHTKSNKKAKYLYSPGLKKDDTLFNLSAVKGKKDLIIVEGILDALIATSRGVENVVALGGTTLNIKQINRALKCGTQKITLCFDNDISGREATFRAIQLILEETNLKCFVASFSSKAKDPDELIIKEGINSFVKAIDSAEPSFLFLMESLFKKYSAQPSWKEIDQIQQEVISIASSIKDPIDKDIFENKFLDKTKHLGISKGSLQTVIDEIKFDKEKAQNKASLSAFLSEAQNKLQKGSSEDIVPFLEEKINKLKYSSFNLNYTRLLDITTEEDIRKKMASQPESLRSGYLFREAHGHSGYDELSIPAGALSIIAARTSHGKTAMLMNLALNIAENYPEKTVHFFSLEEDKEAIIIKLLNIFINKELKSGVKNVKYIRNYFKTSGSSYHNPEFLNAKEYFFKEFIHNGRINVHYASSDTDELISAIKYINEKQSPGAVLIDYIQLLNLRQQFQSRQLELQSICNKLLKDVAVTTGLPLILGAQFNREVIEEGMLDATKIREAGDIEQTANLILGLWNRGYTNETRHKDKKGRNAIHNPNEIFVEVLKNRDGQSGIVSELDFNGSTGKISNKYDNNIT